MADEPSRRVDLQAIDAGDSASVLRPVKKPSPKVRRKVKELNEALGGEGVRVVPVEKGVVSRIRQATEHEEDSGYHDQESEWEDEADQALSEESPLRQFNEDFTGDGLSGKTDVTEEMSVLLLQIRLLDEDYGSKYPLFKLEKFPEWLERYRLSIGRKSRAETVEINRGQVNVQPPGTVEMPPKTRGY